MKIPESMLCRSQRYKLEHGEQNKVKCSDGIEVGGLCCIINHKITIEKGNPTHEEAEIIFHEWGHGIWEEVGLNEEEALKNYEHPIVCAYAKDMLSNAKEIMLVLSQLPGMRNYLKSLVKKA